MERYDEALVDFNRGIELDSTYAWAIGRRGLVSHRPRSLPQSLADFSRAHQLDPNEAWIIANRGEAHQMMEHYDEALVDFNRGIETRSYLPAWAIGRRGLVYERPRSLPRSPG